MSSIFPRLDRHLILSNKIEAPTVVKAIESIRQELVHKLTQLGIGNRLSGEVIAKLPDGSFIAKIADLPVHVELPRNPAIGQKISLTVSQILPHPIFTLHESEQGPSFVSAKLVTGKSETPFHDYIRQLSSEKQGVAQGAAPNDGQTLAEAAPANSTINTRGNQAVRNQHISLQDLLRNEKSVFSHSTTPATPETELSPAARLISQVLKEQSGSQTLAQIRAPKALLSLQQLALPVGEMGAQFAKAIRQNLQESGLFYESHLAQWLDHKRSITELKREPQAQLPATPAAGDDTVLQHLTQGQHEQLSQLVGQQLNLLDQQRLQYLGWLTSAIPFHWNLEARDQPSSHTPQPPKESAKVWASTLEVNLPELGKISIAFTLRNNKLELSLQGNRVDAIEKLNDSFPELASHLQASGTDIVSYKGAYHELP